jgi:uncharacterized membrane protein YbhN (UPF0104 family)
MAAWKTVGMVAVRIALFALAGWALRRELVGLQGAELLRHLASYGPRHLMLGLACTIGSFLALGLIERLALRYANAPTTARRRVMTTAFVANAFSQSVGLALLTGAAVRMRAYARSGLDAADVARVSAFVTLTVTLGLLGAGAVALLASTAPLALGRMSIAARPLGALLALTVLAYLAWSMWGTGNALGHGRWRIQRPSASLAAAQLLLSTADWLLTGTVLFALLPPGTALGYGELLRVYLVAQTIGVASHVPGGAGVFEVVVLTLVARGDASRRAALLSALVLFRVLYYLAPLLVASLIAALSELRAHRAAAAVTRPARATVDAGAEGVARRVG